MRRLLPALACILLLQAVAWTESLQLRVDGDHLRANVAGFHFLTGYAMERLRNGAAVTYILQMTVRGERAGKSLARISERFTVSYDLWEEKFAVTRQSTPSRSASNLSAAAAEAWCVENVTLPVAQLPTDRPFWVALEFASVSAKEPNRSVLDELSLGTLVDILSRRSHDDPEVHGVEEVGPIRLDDLRKKK